MFTIAQLLDDPVLDGAVCLAGCRSAATREVQWTSVIHWPAVEFARPGELVLTTGVGCEAETLEEFMLAILRSDAAGLAVSFPPSGAVTSVSPKVLERADEIAFPIIRLPWSVRFADVARRVIDVLVSERYAARLDASDSSTGGFMRTVLDGGGPHGLARRLEQVIRRPAILFDDAFRIVAAGELTVERLGTGGVAEVTSRSVELTREQVSGLDRLLEFGGPRMIRGLDALGLPSGTGIAGIARHHAVGYVYVLDDAEGQNAPLLPTLELLALEEAATALAVELLRQRAGTAAHTQGAPELLWELATRRTESKGDAIRTLSVLGVDVHGEYEVAVGTAPDAAAAELAAARLATELAAAGRGRHAFVAARSDRILVLSHSGGDRNRLAGLLSASTRGEAGAVSWGLARAPLPVSSLAAGYDDATRVLEAGLRIDGPGQVVTWDQVKPFLMLRALGEDPLAREVAEEAVGALVDYDERTGRGFIETYEAYVAEQFNTSRTARRLHLNRHSLLYRLGKIEELTGRQLDNPADRFLLELSLKLVRLGVLDHERG
jgi:purine catabolism regulator